MLSPLEAARRQRPRPQQSLRQEYEEFLLERIEEFKERLSRAELMAIADEAVRELEAGAEEQLVLTEVLILEHVDGLIMRRLNLPTYRRWRERHGKLRRAQRQPTHWGLEPDTPLVRLAPDPKGLALVAGAAAAPAALFLSAHEWAVLFLDGALGTVEAMETRAAAEALAARLQALVVSLGDWFPDVEPSLAVLDAVSLGRLSAERRERFLATLCGRTPSGGTHCFQPSDEQDGTRGLVWDAILGPYDGWRIDPGRGNGGSGWVVAVKP